MSIGWYVLDVTSAVRLWQKDYLTNNGLQLEITETNVVDDQVSSGSSQQLLIPPQTVGLRSIRNAKPNQEVLKSRHLIPYFNFNQYFDIWIVDSLFIADFYFFYTVFYGRIL